MRAGIFCAVVSLLVAGCGGGGGIPASLVVSCGEAVGEGTTVRLRLHGEDFDFDLLDVEASAGTVANLTVDSPELLSFDFTAPAYPPGTLGPVAVTFTLVGPGLEPSSCEVLVHLAPFVATCATSYAPDSHAAPTTGIHGGAFVVATLTGGNFLAGGALLVEPRGGGIVLLEEVAPGAPFTAPGQFRVLSGTALQFSVPDVFSEGEPTILDGSPNAGPATLRMVTPFAATATEEECFRYVASFLDFHDFRFELPGSIQGLPEVPGLSSPGKVATGDVNLDGVPDIVVLAQQTTSAGSGAPDAFVLIADTFGPGVDRDGDGRSPDFAGSFTAQIVNHPDMQTWVPDEARGQSLLLANLDGDPEPEIAFSVLDDQGGVDPVLLVDILPGGVVGPLTVLRPPITPDYTGGIAVGDFDRTSPHLDIAVLYGGEDEEDRRLVVFRSNAAFDYTATVHDVPAAFENHRPGALGAGDFDGDGDDDLVWGHYDTSEPGFDPEHPEILVARVDAVAGAVGTPQVIANITGSPVVEIDVFDANGDGREDALVYVGGETDGTLVADPYHTGAGVVTLLDAFGLEADAFTETPYRYAFWDRAGNGRGLAHGDFDGDGVTDLATVNDFGEILVMTGNGDGTFEPSLRSWQVVTGWTESTSPIQSLDAADFDGDGLAEIVVGDMSNPPFNVVYWLNASR